ncbi:MAG: type II toxin-antitoxin system RelE/ParE family toxin [Thermosynechococcaceae cyanobacterium MS004]|nr:type II toxin-antitoxin system RelE/ParE family toxin [Thermosynechococcaceae cyanobacterium MS004]
MDTIADYYLTRNIEAGENLFQEFTRKCENLVRFPSLGRSYGHIRPGMRGIPLDSYIIFYQIVNDGVEVLRVVGGRQDLEELF